MRSTINLDDTLIERARSLTGTKETAVLVRQALDTCSCGVRKAPDRTRRNHA